MAVLSEEARLLKNAQIKKSGQETRERRKTQATKTCELKIVSNKLKPKQLQTLRGIFLQSKWFINDIISHLEGNKLSTYDASKKSVEVRLGSGSNKYETREVDCLGAHVKQAIFSRVGDSLKGLKASKDNGNKVGKLNYVKEVKSVPLKQYGNTHKVLDSHHVQVVKLGRLRVGGLDQIPQDAEIGPATLIQRPDGYYVNLTYFIPLEIDTSWWEREDVGIDLNIGDTLVTSTGEKFQVRFEVSPRLKKLQRKLSRQEKGSANYLKTLNKIKRGYQKTSRKKEDTANKIVRRLLDNYGIIYMQDEMLKNWQSGWFGKQVSVSILGRLKAKLKSHTRVCVVNKSCPTTQLCPQCSKLNKIPLSERDYSCSCGYTSDRDIHSASNMLVFGMDEHNVVKSSGVGRASTPVEHEATAAEPSGAVVSLCGEVGNRHPQPALRR